MGWRQGPTGPVWVDEGDGATPGGTKTYEQAIREANQPSADSPYAIALSQTSTPSGGGAGFGSGMAPKGAGAVQARMTAPQGQPPDGWPGWKWTGAGWTDKHDPGGHAGWIQTKQVADSLAAIGQNRPGAAGAELPSTEHSRDPNLDQAALDPYRADREAALESQREVLKFALGIEGPRQLSPEEREALEQRFAERALRTANSAAANARGGAGAVASQRLLVNQQMPGIVGDANQQAQQAASQEFASRVQAFNARVGQAQAAGGIANTIGQTATGAFGQEAQTQQAQAQIDISVIGLDQSAQAQVLDMAKHLDQLNLDYDKLDVATQLAILDDLTTRYGIDKNAATQLKISAEQNKMTPLKFIAGIAGVASDAVSAAKGVGAIK